MDNINGFERVLAEIQGEFKFKFEYYSVFIFRFQSQNDPTNLYKEFVYASVQTLYNNNNNKKKLES